MGKGIAVLLFLVVAGMGGVLAQPLGEGVHRVLFLGNSITYAGGYITDMEAWYLAQHPKDSIEFMNLGLTSETVSGLSEPGHAGGRFPRPDLHERLHRILEKIRPDVVFACYGMNDGIYMSFDEGRFQRYKDGMQWLHDTLVSSTGARVILLTPPVYDELRGGVGPVFGVAADATESAEMGGGGYSFSDEALSRGASQDRYQDGSGWFCACSRWHTSR